MKKVWNDIERAKTRKICPECTKEKSLLEYYRHRQMKDQHLNKCKECIKKDVKTHRTENIEKVREYDRKRSTLPHRIERNKNTCKKFREDFPLKYKAHRIVNNAIRDGKLTKPETCETCNRKGRQIEGHHDDYTKPLEVTWLCSACHKQLHRDLRSFNP